ncbi:MAG: thiolase family protein [Thermoplasmata archaeon]|nr:thiolase family protein [Thermoplasmata archaeon]
MRVHVEASGLARFGRRPETLVDLLAEAGAAALEGTGRKPIDALVVGTMAAGPLADVENVTSRLADRLGLESAAGWRVEAASATGAAAFHSGAMAIASGQFRRVLVVAGEKMTGLPTADAARILARTLAPQEQAAGATMPALAALVTQLYAGRHATAPAIFDLVTVLARAAAARNPMAQFSTPVTAEEVSASRMVSTPLRLLHCSAMSDGAAAVALSRGDGPASLLGLGQGFDQLLVSDREDVTSFRASRVAAERAYSMAKLTRKEIAFAELHDAFAPFLLIDLEDIGACGPGEAGRWLEIGATTPEGRFPVNPSGGLLGRGHPVGASGLAQLVEVSRQLKGEAGPTQLPRPGAAGLALSIGGLASHNFVTILGRRGAS